MDHDVIRNTPVAPAVAGRSDDNFPSAVARADQSLGTAGALAPDSKRFSEYLVLNLSFLRFSSCPIMPLLLNAGLQVEAGFRSLTVLPLG